MPDANFEEFEQRGYCVVPASRPDTLTALRVHIRDVAFRLIGATAGDVDVDLNTLHKHFSTPDQATKFRLELTTAMVEHFDVGAAVFEAFGNYLPMLVGNDVLAQRVPNVVFQPPGDPHPTELHRDAPANSPYEVVVWLPLVDCFGTKSMYLLDRKSSAEALTAFRSNPDGQRAFQSVLEERAVQLSVPYGSALLFWPALFHGSVVNTEGESRVSLNTRFKNLFAPLGMKDPFRYFSVLHTSPLTRMGMQFQREEA
jgi:sporadic carbohydrate cluster 2OG-Fe(II) oxygenase